MTTQGRNFKERLGSSSKPTCGIEIQQSLASRCDFVLELTSDVRPLLNDYLIRYGLGAMKKSVGSLCLARQAVMALEFIIHGHAFQLGGEATI